MVEIAFGLLGEHDFLRFTFSLSVQHLLDHHENKIGLLSAELAFAASASCFAVLDNWSSKSVRSVTTTTLKRRNS